MDWIADLLGGWSQEFNIYSSLFKIALCLVMGVSIGAERTRNFQAAGLKTFVSVSIASALAGIFDFYQITVAGAAMPIACPLIILATAIISSNTILFNSKNQFKGLTTSVRLICTESMALVVAHGFYFVGIVGFFVYLLGLAILPSLEVAIKRRSALFEIYVELKSRESLQKFVQALRQLGLQIKGVELNPAYANSGLAVYSISLKIQNKELGKVKHKEIIDGIAELDMVSYIEEIL